MIIKFAECDRYNIERLNFAFTLAEVLITLAIIGVVATMTLPALMTNTAEQQAKTGLKKGINTLTEAAHMNQAIDGFDYASLTESGDDDGKQSLYSLLLNRTNIDINASGASKLISQTGTASSKASENYAVFFRDGSALLFPANVTSSGVVGKSSIDNSATQDDGLVYGIPVIFDTNGKKGPNIVSNCAGKALGADTDKDNSCTKANRVIKDQFGIRLRGGFAVPNGPAARWAFEN